MATATDAHRIKDDQSTAISAFAALGVVFDAKGQRVLKDITDGSSEKDCIAVGATVIYMKHRYRRSMCQLREEQAAIFTNITVMFNGVPHHPGCWFSYWDEAQMRVGTTFFLVSVAYYASDMLPFHEEHEAYWTSRDIVADAGDLPEDLVAYAKRDEDINRFLEDRRASEGMSLRIKLVQSSWTSECKVTEGEKVYPCGTRFEEVYHVHFYCKPDRGATFLERSGIILFRIDGVWATSVSRNL